eukprot:scaffold197021_cov68-Attheya_sp.AAC.6
MQKHTILDAWLIASGNNNNSGGGGGGPSVTFTFDVLTVVLLLSSVLYGFCFILAKRRLSVLHRIHPEMGTKKLLVLSVALVCLVRIMTFIGVAAMNMANVRAHYTLKPDTGNHNEDTHQAFYDDAMTVLFDLPNCIVVSTYVLLTLVWAECFVQSRFHNEDVSKWRIRCLGAYTVFNSFLFATQMILYILVFVSSSTNTFRTILYAAMTGINFVSVSLVTALYIFLKRHFSVRSPFTIKCLGLTMKISILPNLSHMTSSSLCFILAVIPFCVGVSASVDDCQKVLVENIQCHGIMVYVTFTVWSRHASRLYSEY